MNNALQLLKFSKIQLAKYSKDIQIRKLRLIDYTVMFIYARMNDLNGFRIVGRSCRREWKDMAAIRWRITCFANSVIWIACSANDYQRFPSLLIFWLISLFSSQIFFRSVLLNCLIKFRGIQMVFVDVRFLSAKLFCLRVWEVCLFIHFWVSFLAM